MRLLLDSCVWGPTRDTLEASGHDVLWAGDWEKDPGDQEILDRAFRESRVLVTLDKDFGELAVVHGRPHAGILRLVGFQAREQAAACAAVLREYGEELQRSTLITAEPGRVRIRPPED